MAELTRNPTSDEAVSGTWTGTAGSRWQVVDDYPDTTGADFITCSAAGAITFGFTAFSIPTGSTAITVFVDYYDLKNGSQASAIAGRLKCGASYFNAATHNPTNATWVQRTDTFANNPATAAAWTVDQINGVGSNALAAFGVNVSDASPSVSLSSIRVRVQYTPPAQNFDGTITSATFSALNPTFEAGNANFNTTPPSGTFTAIDPTFIATANFDVSPTAATFSALDVVFDATPASNFDATPATASCTPLDVTFAVASPQDFDVGPAVLGATALDVSFQEPAPPQPDYVRRGGGGGVMPTEWRRRRERRAERLDHAVERLELLLDEERVQRKQDRQKKFLTAAAGFLATILIKRSR